MPAEEASGAPPDVVDRVYGVGLGEFVTARAAAAKELRAQGRRPEAAAVQALRKPTAAAWIVNRLARDQEQLVADLLAAGARLREAQLSAGSAAEIRAASQAEQAALDDLTRAAAATRSGGASLERVRETLHAAALDPDLADTVRRGVLLREQQAVGFPLGAAVPAVARKPARPKPATHRLERAAAAVEAAHEELAQTEQKLADARAAQEAAARELELARTAVTTAERQARQADRAAERAAAARDLAARRAEQAADRRAAADKSD
jgi:hypothetical protein